MPCGRARMQNGRRLRKETPPVGVFNSGSTAALLSRFVDL